jgi:hypothetical protein
MSAFEKPSVFEYSEKNPLKDEVIVNTQNAFQEMGYEVVDETLEEAIKFYETELPQINDPKSFFGREIAIDETRLKLPRPEFIALRKAGKLFAGVKYADGTILILDANPQEVIMGMYNRTQVLQLHHFLVPGSKGRSLDLMSIRPNKDARVLFSFSGKGSGFSPEREYLNRRNEVIGIYPPDVYLTWPHIREEKGNIVWDRVSEMYLFLHENGHAGNTNYDTSEAKPKSQEKERNANALAITITRMVTRKYREDKFLDQEVHKQWAEKQMIQGYDKHELYIPNDVDGAEEAFRLQTSSLRRGIVRGRLFGLKGDMNNKTGSNSL